MFRGFWSLASVLDGSGVLFCIVQCVESPADVVSLLEALPWTRYTPALDALHTLLTTMRNQDVHGKSFWPRPQLGATPEAAIPYVATAMPAFPGLYVDCNSVSDRWPVPQGSVFASPFCAFVAQWAHKVERFDETFRITVTDAQGTEFSRLLLLCTKVKAVTLYNDNGTDLRAILKAPYRISELHLIDFDDSNSGTRDDWAVPVMQWLTLDRAFRLGLSGCKSHCDADVARAIASAPALSTLHLNDCDVICAGLVANALPLCHVTELVLDATLERLAPLLDISKLTTLELCGDGNELLACSLGALQTCSALEHLSLDHVAVYGPALRTWEIDAKLRSVRVVSSDVDASIAEMMLDWIASSKTLESVTWVQCAGVAEHFGDFGSALQRWVQNGVQSVTFEHNEAALQDVNAKSLADALRSLHAPTHCTLDLGWTYASVEGYRMLLDALPVCTNVTLVLCLERPNWLAEHMPTTGGHVTMDVRGDRYELHSRRRTSRLSEGPSE